MFDSYAARVLRYFLDATRLIYEVNAKIPRKGYGSIGIIVGILPSRVEEESSGQRYNLHRNTGYMSLEEILVDVARRVVIWRWARERVGNERLAFEGNSNHICCS